MTESTSLNTRGGRVGLLRGLGASALALALFTSQTAPAFAAIDNTATANGTPAAGTLVPPSDSASVPVVTGAPTLTVLKSAAAPVDTVLDGVIQAGDTITYTYVVTNSGNVSIDLVTPVDTGPTFNDLAGTGSLSGFTLVSTTNGASSNDTLLPNESGTWTAIYSLSAVDAYRAAGITLAGEAVENSATATGDPAAGTLGTVIASTAEVEIPANPRLSIDKVAVITSDGPTIGVADVGDIITYTYTVVNTGNVAISALAINDIHEMAALSGEPSAETLTSDGPLAAASPSVLSTDATADSAVWDLIQPGATVTFTYVHTVTQAEVDAG